MEWDLVFKGANLIIGDAVVERDLAVKGDRIDAIDENLSPENASQVIDASGLCLAPGFIDVHTHDDIAVITQPEMRSKLSQGVTTVITGNCGISAAPAVISGTPPDPMAILGFEEVFQYPTFGDYAKAVSAAVPGVNVASLVGHTTLRSQVMGGDYSRAATEDEISAMCTLLSQALAEGATGFSSGLAYSNARHAPSSEIERLLEVVAEHGACYSTHMRDERKHLMQSIQESLESSRKTDVQLIISHLKCADPENWGKSAEALAMIERASREQRCGVDCYPYSACSTTLDLWRVREDFDIRITWSKRHPEQSGKLLKDIAQEWNVSLLDAAEQLMPAGGIFHNMAEEDVDRIVTSPLTMIGSDGLPSDPNPHPRLWGTFTRVLAHYCRDKNLLSLTDAIRKMTLLPAQNFGLKERGELKPGYFADLTLFDFENLQSPADFENSCQPSTGIECVVVNGAISYRNGAVVQRAGRMLLRATDSASRTQS